MHKEFRSGPMTVSTCKLLFGRRQKGDGEIRIDVGCIPFPPKLQRRITGHSGSQQLHTPAVPSYLVMGGIFCAIPERHGRVPTVSEAMVHAGKVLMMQISWRRHLVLQIFLRS